MTHPFTKLSNAMWRIRENKGGLLWKMLKIEESEVENEQGGDEVHNCNNGFSNGPFF